MTRILRTTVLAGAAVLLVATPTLADNAPASASPVMIVTCSAPTGLNIGSDIERDQPTDSVQWVYDPEAKAYVSHPTKTERQTITVNSNGTATETSFSDDGTALVTNMHILGKITADTINMIGDGPAAYDMLTLYPKESIAVLAGTSYDGWHKPIPMGYAYIAHCKFSHVLQ